MITLFRTYFYQWPLSCLPLAVLTFIFSYTNRCLMGELLFLVWIQFAVYLLHQTEEHFLPGGFKHFINKKVFKSSIPNTPFDEADVFWINIPFIWILFPLVAVMAQHIDIALGAFLPVFALVNATTHIVAWFIFRAYNPGLVVSLVLNYPTGLYALRAMLDSAAVTSGILVVMTGLAIALHIGMVVFAVARYKRL